LGKAVIDSMPVIRQAVIARARPPMSQDAFERKLLAIRKQTQNPLAEVAEKHQPAGPGRILHAVSLSTRTIVYKGLLLAGQVGSFYDDLRIRCVSRSHWFTSASRPTPSPAGSWRTPIASSPTTAKSTRCAAT
jgi:glutamate synthase domain-containing protein 1